MTDHIPSRRGFLAGRGPLLAAPAVVKAENLMPIRPWPRRRQRLRHLPRHADPVRESAMDLDLLLHPPRATLEGTVAALSDRQLWARLANDRHYLVRACGRVWTDPNDPNRYVIPVQLVSDALGRVSGHKRTELPPARAGGSRVNRSS
jgi:hypothetical protein